MLEAWIGNDSRCKYRMLLTTTSLQMQLKFIKSFYTRDASTADSEGHHNHLMQGKVDVLGRYSCMTPA